MQQDDSADQPVLLDQRTPSPTQASEAEDEVAGTAAAPTLQPSHDSTSTPAPTRAATGDRSTSADTRAQRRQSAHDQDFEVRRVSLDEIDGVDEDIEQFLREHDICTDLWLQVDRWSPAMRRCALQNLHLVLWSRRGRLVLLGTGKALTLARRLALHDDKLPATIVQAKTLNLQQKLVYVGYELLFQTALHRASAGYPAVATATVKALDKTGVSALNRSTLRDFAAATGMSASAIKQHWQSSTGTL